jgi:hypothetical protein
VPGPLDRAGVALDGGHPRPGVLVRDRQRDGARAAAQVDDDRLGQTGQPRERPLDELLGLRSGHEDAGADRELEVTERRATREVLQRHPVGALSGEGLEAGDRVVRHLAEGEQAGAGDAEDVGEQQLGVHPW